MRTLIAALAHLDGDNFTRHSGRYGSSLKALRTTFNLQGYSEATASQVEEEKKTQTELTQIFRLRNKMACHSLNRGRRFPLLRNSKPVFLTSLVGRSVWGGGWYNLIQNLLPCHLHGISACSFCQESFVAFLPEEITITIFSVTVYLRYLLLR